MNHVLRPEDIEFIRKDALSRKQAKEAKPVLEEILSRLDLILEELKKIRSNAKR